MYNEPRTCDVNEIRQQLHLDFFSFFLDFGVHD